MPPKHDNAARMAASRARGAAKGGFVAGARKPAPPGRETRPSSEDRDERSARVMAALERHGGDVHAAAAELAMAPHTVGMVAHHARRRAKRAGDNSTSTVDSSKASIPAESVKPTGVQRAPLKHSIQVSRAGLTDAEHRRAVAAAAKPPHIVSTESPIEGREAGVPATDADDRGQPDASGSTGVATPLGSPELVPGIPCGTCSHAAVCVIKPTLERWAEKLKAPAPPDPALTVTVARLEVGCTHYLAVPA